MRRFELPWDLRSSRQRTISRTGTEWRLARRPPLPSGSRIRCCCVVLLWARPQWWWALLAATVPIRVLIALPPDVPLLFAGATTLIDCGKAVAAAALLRRTLRNPLRFQTVRDFGVYCLVVVLAVPALSAFAGALTRWVIGYTYWPGWQQWFLGDALASLIITPFIFYWILSPPDARQVAAPRRIEAAVLFCCMLASFWFAFEPSSTALGFADVRMYLPTALLVWAAIRFGMVGAFGAIALLAVFAVGSAVSGHGVFSADSPETVGANLQRFLLHTAPLYLLAVLIDQTRRGAESLRESERRFRDLADTAPALIWMAGPDKLCDFFNANWLDFTGRTLEEESGNGWAAGVHPDDSDHCFKIYVSCFDARLPFEMDYRLRRHDGEYRWILEEASRDTAQRVSFSATLAARSMSRIVGCKRRRCDEARSAIATWSNSRPTSFAASSRIRR